MEIVVDLTKIQELLNLPSDVLLKEFLINVGWIPIAFVFLWGFKEMWLSYIRNKWAEDNANFVLLAIDIPRDNLQSPKAVENMFHYLAGAHGSINLVEKYWEGKWQLYFSFEIVSIEGYTQFLIYTPTDFRDLVESAVYSQYPDAEITEVDDYTSGYPTRYPDDKYDIWGAEIIQAHNPMYPIKTYKEFEHQNDPAEEIFKDPMATLMDLDSSLGPGEQLWFQTLVIPIGFDWLKKGDEKVSKILGEKKEGGSTGGILKGFLKIIDGIVDSIMSFIYVFPGIEESKEEEPFKMMNLKPKTKRQVEAVEEKTSKFAFETKMRMVYLAEKEVIRKTKVVNGFVGFLKQFGDLALNNLKPDVEKTGTTTAYFFKDSRVNARKRRILNAYRKRDDNIGRDPGIMNTEELATLWHFPVSTSVHAPLVQQAPGRKSEPPMGLPRSPKSARGSEPESQEVPDFFTSSAEASAEAPEEEEEESSEPSSSPSSSPKEQEKESSGDDTTYGTPPGNLPTV